MHTIQLYMKAKIFIVSGLIFILGLTSCSDFLNYNEVSEYSQEQIFTNFGRTEQFVINIYSYMRSDFASVDGAMRAAGCDEAIHVWSSSDVHTFTNGTWSPIKTVDDVWGNYYKGIRAANFYLENGTGKTFDEYKYDQEFAKYMRKYKNYQYEVRFLRAYYYFELIKRYGGVPIVTKVMDIAEANTLKRDSFDMCVRFIADECDTVAKYLPKVYDGLYDSETGRITSSAAYALKSRLLLYSASPLHNPDNNPEKWRKAALAAQDLLDILKITTLQPYESAFNNLTSTEVILDRREGDSGGFERINFPIGFEGGNTGTCPSQNLVDAYGMKSGVYSATEPYKNRDPRLDKSVVLNNTLWAYNEVVEAWEGGNSGLPKTGASTTGYYLKKYLVKDVNFKPSGTTTARHNWVIFRGAEVLLNYAEAVNEVFQNPNMKDATFKKTAIEAVNIVRKRLLISMPNIPTTVSYTTFKTETIRNERFVELAFEDHRFWDIRRWKIGPQTVDIYGMKIIKNTNGTFTYTKQLVETRYWDDKYYLYPIPQSEIYKNRNLEQNPGWEL